MTVHPASAPRRDPRLDGAKCEECPCYRRFKGDEARWLAQVVPAEIRPGTPLFVGTEPADQEVQEGRPYVGPSGKEVEATLRLLGLSRQAVSFTNTRLCPLMKTKTRRQDDRASKAACRPRLLKELAAAPAVVAMGKDAMEEVYAKEARGDAGLAKLRGFPLRLDLAPSEVEDESVRGVEAGLDGGAALRAAPTPLLVTWQPTFVLHERRWTPFFRSDIAKAFRYFAGKLNWVEPTVVTDPSPEQLDAVLDELWRRKDWVAFDIETDSVYALTTRVRCMALGDASLAVSVGLISVESPPRVFRTLPSIAVERFRNFLATYNAHCGTPRLCGAYINIFDRPIVRRLGIELPPYYDVCDVTIAHHITDSEYRHDLNTLMSILTDAPRHKPLHGHDAWKYDVGPDGLQTYNCLDVSGTARCVPPLVDNLTRTDQWGAYYSDVHYQELCVGMHDVGVYQDQAERDRHRRRLLIAKKEAQQKALDALPEHPVKLSSSAQVRDLLFVKLGLPETEFRTKNDEPSTDINAIYALMSRALPDNIHAWLDALFLYRRATKWLGTYIDGKGTTPDAIGRIHPQWHPHVTVVGRLSSSEPGIQQWPGTKHDLDDMRSIIAAAPGNVLVYADMSQLHLRLVAGHIDDALWKECFRKGLNVHRVNGVTFYAKPYESIEKGSFEYDFSKTMGLALIYGAEAPTVLEQLHKARNPKTGERPYATMTLDDVEGHRESFLEDHPNLQPWWHAAQQRFVKQRFLATPYLKRRHYFRDAFWSVRIDEESARKMPNYEILGLEGDIMGGHGAAGKFVAEIPFGVYGPGLVAHFHDALLAEVKIEYAERCARAMLRAMTGEYMGVPLTAEPKVGPSMAKLAPIALR